MRPVFVISDVHGKYYLIKALLEKAGVKERSGISVQLGDLGHHGTTVDPHADQRCFHLLRDGVIDVGLWGNHDRAIVDRKHVFSGYSPGTAQVLLELVDELERKRRLKMAYAAHGWLITHAGLHPQYESIVTGQHGDVEGVAGWLNNPDNYGSQVHNAISWTRGGGSAYGGILWRDIEEPLSDAVPQVFGHSASPIHEIRGEKDHWWCIDVGGRPSLHDPAADCLAGIWLPSQEVVRVGPNDRIYDVTPC